MSGGSWIGAAVQGGSSLIGNIMNTSGRKLRRMMRYQKDYDKYISDLNWESWQKQQEYNSPANQMQRYQEAGLNPNLVYGTIDGNAVGSVPYSESMDIADKVGEQSSLGDAISSVGSAVGQGIYQAQAFQQQAETNEAQNSYTEALRDFTNLKASILDADEKETGDARRRHLLDMFEQDRKEWTQKNEMYTMQLNEAAQQLRIMMADAGLKEFNLKTAQESHDMEMRIKAEQVKSLMWQTAKSKMMQALEAEYLQTQIDKNNRDINHLDFEENYRKDQLAAENAQQEFMNELNKFETGFETVDKLLGFTTDWVSIWMNQRRYKQDRKDKIQKDLGETHTTTTRSDGSWTKKVTTKW